MPYYFVVKDFLLTPVMTACTESRFGALKHNIHSSLRNSRYSMTIQPISLYPWLIARLRAVATSSLLVLGVLQSFPLSRDLWDFASFLLSGRAWLAGLPIYDFSAQFEFLETHQIAGCFPNLNPPVWLPLFSLFSILPPYIAFLLWWFFNVLVSGLTVWFNRGDAPLFFLALLGGSAPLWATASLGQVYVVLFLIVLLLDRHLEKGRTNTAPILLASLVMLKPNFALTFLPLLIERRFQFVAVSIVWIAMMGVGSILLFGLELHLEYLAMLSSRTVPSLATNASVWQISPAVAGLVAILYTALAILSSLKKTRIAPLRCQIYSGLCFSLLFSPICWVGYIVVLWPFLLRRHTQPLIIIALTLLLVPSSFVFNNYLDFWPLSLVYPTALLCLFIDSLNACGIDVNLRAKYGKNQYL